MPKKINMRTHETEKRTAQVLYRAGTLNVEERMIEFVMATDTPADFGYYHEILGMDEGEMRTQRLDAGIVPVLDSHPQSQWKNQTIDDQFGVVIEWRKEGGQVIGKLLFSSDERSDKAFRKVSEGIVKTGSIGYFVYRHKKISGPNDKLDIYRAIDWEIVEFSLVSIPRDPNAQARNQTFDKIQTFIEDENSISQERNSDMPPEQKPTAEELEKATKEAATKAAKETQDRILDIQSAVRAAGLEESYATELIGRGVSMGEASKEIFAKMAEKKAAAPATTVMPALDINHGAEDKKREERIKAMAGAIIHRADPKATLAEESREFANMRLLDIARRSLALQGKNVSFMDNEAVIRAAFQTTSDFPEITGAAINMSVKRGWDTVTNNYENLVTHTSRTDFREGGSVSLSDAPVLQEIDEHGEFETGTFEESAEKYAVKTFGVEAAITRQTMYNDHYQVFGKVPFSLGASGARTVKDLVWAIFIKNAKLSSDGKAIFHADHKNLAAAVASLDSSALAALRLLLRKQQSPKGKIMNYNPGYLVVSAELEEAGEKLFASLFPAKTTDANVHKDNLRGLIVEGTLGAKDFYLTGRNEEVDMIELGWLNGNRGVQVQQIENPGILGVKWNVFMDVGAAPMDFRGLTKGAIT